MPEILLGAGSRRDKRLGWDGREAWDGLITVDHNADHKPDIVHDLTVLPYPFKDNFADEIHAYDVMEHLGQQGDWRWFFDQWTEIWRILKPGGRFFGISPHWSSPWCWGDPSHTRVISPECLVFLQQPQYTKQIGNTPMSDFRFYYKADFDVIYEHVGPLPGRLFSYALEAVKPSRITA